MKVKNRLVSLIAICLLGSLVASLAAAGSPEGENPAHVGAILKQAMPLVAEGQLTGPPVALIADKDTNLSDVEQKVLGTGKIGSVAKYNVYSGPVPSLSELQGYDAVLVWGGGNPWGSTVSEALGNVLADYVDGGGGVVVATFSLGSGLGSWLLKGRFDDAAYQCLEPMTNQTGGHQTLGTIHQPGHPILADVSTFDGGSSSYRVDTHPVVGAELVADWTDGLPLIATKDLGFARRADLNFYPASSDVRSDFWDASTDGDEIMANALAWVAGSVGPTIDIEAVPNPATVGDPFAVLLDLDNPGDAFFAKIGLYGMIDSRVNRIRSAVVYISAGYSIIDHPFLSVSSLKPVPPTIGFLCVLFNKNTGELLDWDVEVVGVTTAATAAETLALKKLAEKYVKKANVADFKNTKPDILGKAKAAPPLVGQKASPKGKLSTTWGSIKSKR